MADKMAGDGIAVARETIVYGADDREEVYRASSLVARDVAAESVVALIPIAFVDSGRGVSNGSPALGETYGLCPGEPFTDQPALAFCTGVLVDWDLVLTAGHCAEAFPLDGFSAVFGYYYSAENRLGLAADDVYSLSNVVSARRDARSAVPRLDYAWLRLDRAVSAPKRPAPIRATPGAPGEALLAITAAAGTPLKVDNGGTVHDARLETLDYFVADTDTFHGSSGGGAFDQSGTLLGILARGGNDYVETDAGCLVTAHETSANAQEQYTYAHEALRRLCAEIPAASNLCGGDTEDRRLATAELPAVTAGGGCAIHASRPRCTPFAALAALLGVALLRARRSTPLPGPCRA